MSLESPAPPMRPRTRLDSVQALRAVAAIAVVTHHIRLFANGAWGVDLFFVISGFIMCYVTAGSRDHFFLKRIIRVVPLYWAGTLAVFGVAIAAPSLVYHTTTSFADLVKSLAFIPFKKGDKTVPVLFLGWTLNYEMFFYLVFAVGLRISHRHRALIASAIMIALAVAGWLADIDNVPLRFLTKPIIVEFAFGMACYTLFARTHRVRERSTVSRLLPTLAGVLLIVCLPLAGAIAPSAERLFVWGIPAALAFYCVLQGLEGLRLPMVLTLIGDASYSLYLFHPYVIQVFTKIFGAFDGSGVYAYCMAGLLIVTCCALAILSYRYLEKPASEFLRKRLIDRTRPATPPATAVALGKRAP